MSKKLLTPFIFLGLLLLPSCSTEEDLAIEIYATIQSACSEWGTGLDQVPPVNMTEAAFEEFSKLDELDLKLKPMADAAIGLKNGSGDNDSRDESPDWITLRQFCEGAIAGFNSVG
jgi:hypothetical protein